ncbi:hypothetical protein Sango_3045400 [Sesamum angolense]|uniref:Uncharacterized protein n=1 Tax=Sesamum angolense TaxID=2727404 RepID=A0AAE1W197_9LAMI|nr:hypothetical protein Sango_3045400 [Sesamum angolense]
MHTYESGESWPNRFYVTLKEKVRSTLPFVLTLRKASNQLNMWFNMGYPLLYENFCVAHLLKLGMVATLSYFILLFFYLLFNLGICQCICRTLCRVVWACFASCISALDFCCTYLCFKVRTIKRKRRRRKRGLEEFAATNEEDCELGERSVTQQTRNLEHGRLQFSKRRDYKNVHLRRS